jgi:hypothetical protein
VRCKGSITRESAAGRAPGSPRTVGHRRAAFKGLGCRDWGGGIGAQSLGWRGAADVGVRGATSPFSRTLLSFFLLHYGGERHAKHADEGGGSAKVEVEQVLSRPAAPPPRYPACHRPMCRPMCPAMSFLPLSFHKNGTAGCPHCHWHWHWHPPNRQLTRQTHQTVSGEVR